MLSFYFNVVILSFVCCKPWKGKEHPVYTTVWVLWDADFRCFWVTLSCLV